MATTINTVVIVIIVRSGGAINGLPADVVPPGVADGPKALRL
jgi:hypothetical protein